MSRARKMAPDDVIPLAKEQWSFGRSYKRATIAKIAKRLKQLPDRKRGSDYDLSGKFIGKIRPACRGYIL
jgi:hypothetical protein